MDANDLKPGMAINLDGKLCLVLDRDHVKPGKGPAYVQAKVKAIPEGNLLDKRLRANDDVEQVFIDRREMEHLYSDPTGYVFMDLESFEQLSVSGDLLGDAMYYIRPNTPVTVHVHEGRILSVELPKTVDLQVTDTAPQPKGATQTNQLKEAILETGLKTRVPPFIETGEVVRVNTEDASYISRAG